MNRRTAPHPDRRRTRAVIASLVLFATAVAPAVAQQTARGAEERLGATVEALASPRFGGRLTGSSGNEQAARFLADRLVDLGARPLPGSSSLFHHYEQPVVAQHEPARFSVESEDGKSVDLAPGADFDIIVREGTRVSGTVSGLLLELTGGRARASWVRDNAGAILIVEATEFEAMTRDRALMNALFAPEGGPAALALVLPEQIGNLPRSLAIPSGSAGGGGPYVVNMTADAAARVRRVMRGNAAPIATLAAVYAVVRRSVPNVAALLREGSEASRDGPVILTAHFDGAGMPGGTPHLPAAVDNASGVAVVLEAARSADTGSRPLWVVLFNGEEQGLYGSRSFVADHGSALDGALVVNVDMVGHDVDLAVSISATGDGADLGATLASALHDEGVRATVIDGGMSDHVAFDGHAPAVSLVQAPYPAMHQRSDTAAEIDPALLARISAAVGEAVGRLRSPGTVPERAR